MEEWVWTAIIGVGGTLIGTVLGWILNRLSTNGKLSILDARYTINEQKLVNGVYAGAAEYGKAEYWESIVKFNVYNSSSDAKVMRNIIIGCYNDNTQIQEFVPFDKSLTNYSNSHPIVQKVLPLTIYPKTIKNVTLFIGMHNNENNFDNILQTNIITMSYETEKNKRKTITMKLMTEAEQEENQ